MTQADKFLSAADAAKQLGYSAQHLRKMLRDGDIPSFKLGRGRGTFRVKKSDIDSYIAQAEKAGSK